MAAQLIVNLQGHAAVSPCCRASGGRRRDAGLASSCGAQLDASHVCYTPGPGQHRVQCSKAVAAASLEGPAATAVLRRHAWRRRPKHDAQPCDNARKVGALLRVLGPAFPAGHHAMWERVSGHPRAGVQHDASHSWQRRRIAAALNSNPALTNHPAAHRIKAQ